MKVDITYKCSMNCSHCLSNCDERGQHMTLDTFDKVIEFHRENYQGYILLTGGEIFEHPQIKEFITKAAENFETVMLLTNGQKISSDEELYNFVRDIILRHKGKILMQVTNDPRYYPQKLSPHQQTMLRKIGVKHIEPVQGLYPQGRALLNHKGANWLTIAPKCANVRLLARQIYRYFNEILEIMEQHGKYCTPTISPDGNIRLGESALCPACANIDDSSTDIVQKILAFKCTQCKIPLERLKKNNPTAYKMIEGD